MGEIIDVIKEHVLLPVHELDDIVSFFNEKTIAKDKFLLKKGHVATHYYFVKSGCLRVYFKQGQKEITGWVALENDFFTELNSLKKQSASRFNIQAMENTVLLTIRHDKMHELYERYPKWQQFGRLLWESAFLKVIEGIINYQTLTAEERYLMAMQQPDLLQKIPLKHLSSYLGITPTSLSRLRKNVK